jgi:uncharacterized protein with HEPN domain
MPRDYRLYLEDILEAAQKVNSYLQGVTFEQFGEETMRLDAVLHNLLVIGEAVKSVPPDVRENYPAVEWRKIAGLRDIIAHEYFGINLEIVWDVVHNKLPELHTLVAEILEQEDDEDIEA